MTDPICTRCGHELIPSFGTNELVHVHTGCFACDDDDVAAWERYANDPTS